MKHDYLMKKMNALFGSTSTYRREYNQNSRIMPCNTHRFLVNVHIDTEKKIKDYIRYARDTKHHGQIMFPITEKDIHHNLWLSICKKDKNAQIVETTSQHAGNYKCWLIFYQNNRKAGT